MRLQSLGSTLSRLSERCQRRRFLLNDTELEVPFWITFGVVRKQLWGDQTQCNSHWKSFSLEHYLCGTPQHGHVKGLLNWVGTAQGVSGWGLGFPVPLYTSIYRLKALLEVMGWCRKSGSALGAVWLHLVAGHRSPGDTVQQNTTQFSC